ncbi:MAG: response regulator [Myxococcota bacterium]
MSKKAPVLCVDDEPSVLEGLELHLRKKCSVFSATSGAEGLALLEAHEFAVVMSDMRMPGMNGAEFLAAVRDRAPLPTRILLTGQTDLQSAIAAINEGQIFRFLTKPCTPTQLRSVFEDAVAQHRLVTSEKQLLEETVHGSIKALIGVLGVTQPLAFGRASRLEGYVAQICEELALTPSWPLEVAAMVLQLGTIVLSEETAEKLYYGKPLEPQEQARVDEGPQTVQRLLGSIPRLEPVVAIVEAMGTKRRRLGPELRRSVEILSLANDFDVLIAQGMNDADALGAIRHREEHPNELVDAFARKRGGDAAQEIREIPIGAVREGMVFVHDVKTHVGTLLVPRGFEVTKSFVARVHGYPRGFVPELVRVAVRR